MWFQIVGLLLRLCCHYHHMDDVSETAADSLRLDRVCENGSTIEGTATRTSKAPSSDVSECECEYNRIQCFKMAVQGNIERGCLAVNRRQNTNWLRADLNRLCGSSWVENTGQHLVKAPKGRDKLSSRAAPDFNIRRYFSRWKLFSVSNFVVDAFVLLIRRIKKWTCSMARMKICSFIDSNAPSSIQITIFWSQNPNRKAHYSATDLAVHFDSQCSPQTSVIRIEPLPPHSKFKCSAGLDE